MDAAMAATLAAYKPPPDVKSVPLPDSPKQVVFRDKREAMEALKDLLKVPYAKIVILMKYKIS